MDRFRNREEAGKQLAREVGRYAGENSIVLALPRGGVPIGFEVARALEAPLDIFLVRKLGAPGQEELAMGAIAQGGYRVLNEDVVRALGATDAEISEIQEVETRELHRRMREYRGERPEPDLSGKTVVMVDDGIATGASMQVAVEAVRALNPERIIVAVPTAAEDAIVRLEQAADEVITLLRPRHFYGVGAWYDDFRQTTDQEVRDLLDRAADLGLAP